VKHLESGIVYVPHGQRPIIIRQLRMLYEQEGWWPERSDRAIATVLDTGISIGAWVDDHLVGFTRVVSDGQFRAYVEDVIVHRDYRRRHVGEGLMQRLLVELEDISLVIPNLSAGVVKVLRWFAMACGPSASSPAGKCGGSKTDWYKPILSVLTRPVL